MITPYNVLRHELLGLTVKASVDGAEIECVVCGETAKTIKVKTPSGVKKVMKDSSTLELSLPSDAVVMVRGQLFAGRSEDRIKKKHRIRF